MLLITSVLLSALLPYLMGRAVDLIGARGDLDELATIALITVGAAGLYWICAWQSNRNIQLVPGPRRALPSAYRALRSHPDALAQLL
ncbi:hypothetical protein [Candidatus Chloroploca sp. Khr17]|uniref:hypothetical protein n=1 Tax=Candidatus Chloroploca sp. Khr17 TaxID=2496869 RepID=UPI00101C267B|nr:hypothetical protein [Candidatus Chloroploca sp. Khr17]